MRRCAFFLMCVLVVGVGTARSEYILIRIDLGQVFQHIPAGGAGAVGAGGVGAGGVGAQPIPYPMAQPGSAPVPKGTLVGPLVTGLIEVRSKKINIDRMKGTPISAMLFDHKWGKDLRLLDMPGLTPDVIKYRRVARHSIPYEFDENIKKGLAGSKEPTKYIEVAKWALSHGLPAQFHATMADLAKVAPKDPIVLNYLRVQKELAGKAPGDVDPMLQGLYADLKKNKGYQEYPSRMGRFMALHDLPSRNYLKDIQRRVNFLEDNLETVFYWFALRPELPQPTLPRHMQLLVLTKTSDEFHALHAQWGAPLFVGDAFTARRDNAIVMSFPRVDEVFRSFDRNNLGLLWTPLVITKDTFVEGGDALWKNRDFGNRDILKLVFAQTLTMVQKIMEEDGEVSTLTQEGTRQVLFAGGLLPRHVHTPEWIAYGLANYFSTSPGAPFRSVGLPSWAHVPAIRDLRDNRRLEKPAEVLRQVITDGYFRNVHQMFADLADAADREKMTERLREELEIATSSSWALAYYIIERQRTPELLFRYCQELGTLPRDLDLSPRALEACFAKVFGLGDARNPLVLDEAKFSAFAERWFSDMSGVAVEYPELGNEYLDLRKQNRKITQFKAENPQY